MRLRLTENAQNALNSAVSLAGQLGHNYVGSEHLLLGILSVKGSGAEKILSDCGVSFEKIKDALIQMIGTKSPVMVNGNDLTPRTRNIIERAYTQIALNIGKPSVSTEMLLLSMLQEEDSYAVSLLESTGADISAVAEKTAQSLSSLAQVRGGEYVSDGDGIGDGKMLSQYGRDLCKSAEEGKIDPIIGRDSETQRVIQILSRRTKNNPCLIGEPGVGKTAVVEGLAQKIVSGDVPENLKNKKVYTLDITSMLAGSKYRGEFEERMKGVMEEVRNNPDIILFIDEIHTIIGAGSAEGAVDAANIIKPALSRGEMQLIGATTINEYRKYIEKDAALERRFQPVTVGEPSESEAIEILFGLREKFETHHNLKYSDAAIVSAVKLSERYIADRFLPDKAIDLIDEAGAKKRLTSLMPLPEMKELLERQNKIKEDKEKALKDEDYEKCASLRDDENKLSAEIEELKKKNVPSKGAVVDENDISEIVSSWTGIPVSKLTKDESEKLLELDRTLKERVIGQDEAVDVLSKAIKRGRMGLANPDRPIGSFIFLGPTGVGKTELAKNVADVMFGSVSSMIRIDMSEYMEKHSVSKLIGSPPGYVGFDEGGQLTEKIRRKPYSVVLFDEIEKAHPDVFNILLQILDEGTLTDSQGRKVNFKNTIIILTSNVGASYMTEKVRKVGFAGIDDAEKEEDGKKAVMSALKDTFRPEFLNRLDEIIVFNRLSEEDIKKITSILLGDVKDRAEKNGITLSFDDSAVELLSGVGFSEEYGARPLKRAIVRLVEDALSEEMLRGNVKSGDKITAKENDGKIIFEK